VAPEAVEEVEIQVEMENPERTITGGPRHRVHRPQMHIPTVLLAVQITIIINIMP